MRTRRCRPLTLHRDTLCLLDAPALEQAAAAVLLTKMGVNTCAYPCATYTYFCGCLTARNC